MHDRQLHLRRHGYALYGSILAIGSYSLRSSAAVGYDQSDKYAKVSEETKEAVVLAQD